MLPWLVGTSRLTCPMGVHILPITQSPTASKEAV